MDGKRAAPRKGRRVVFVGDGVPTSHQRGGAALLGPLWGGLSAQPTGGEKNAGHLSLRQRFALTPPSQREARKDGFPRQCEHWLGTTALRAVRADGVVRPYKTA